MTSFSQKQLSFMLMEYLNCLLGRRRSEKTMEITIMNKDESIFKVSYPLLRLKTAKNILNSLLDEIKTMLENKR